MNFGAVGFALRRMGHGLDSGRVLASDGARDSLSHYIKVAKNIEEMCLLLYHYEHLIGSF